MFFVPLNQLESVQLLVNALRVAAGETDCTTCPAMKVCMKQCLTIAESVEKMIEDGTLPQLNGEPVTPQPEQKAAEKVEVQVKEKVAQKGEVLQFKRG